MKNRQVVSKMAKQTGHETISTITPIPFGPGSFIDPEHGTIPGSGRTRQHNAAFRVYEDNDGVNILGQSTDDAYTNGTRLDLFYRPAHRPARTPW